MLKVRVRSIKTLALIAVLALFAAPVRSEERASPPFKAYVASVLSEVVYPSYAHFARTTQAQAEAFSAFCAEPSEAGLDALHSQFENTALAWSRIELYRFGPSRKDNVYARLFFWPDRRSRGLKQVQALIASENPTAIDPETLRAKSVAVQGILALEYVLFGTGNEALISVPDGYRCAYGNAIAETMAQHAETLLRDWQSDEGFGATLMAAGPDQDFYRSHREVVQEFVRAASEQLRVISELKLLPSLGVEPAPPAPRRAPFARSNFVVHALEENLTAVRSLFLNPELPPLLPEEEKRVKDALAFELDQASAALEEMKAAEADWADLVQSPETRRKLVYVTLPLTGARRILAEEYTRALGLTMGFNALDGD